MSKGANSRVIDICIVVADIIVPAGHVRGPHARATGGREHWRAECSAPAALAPSPQCGTLRHYRPGEARPLQLYTASARSAVTVRRGPSVAS